MLLWFKTIIKDVYELYLQKIKDVIEGDFTWVSCITLCLKKIFFEERKSQRYHASGFQTTLWNHNNKKKKQFGTSTKIDTLTRIKSQHIQPTNIWEGSQECLRERAVSATNCAGKLEKHVQNNETGPLSHTIHKAEIDQGLQHKAWYHKTPRRKT